MFVKILMVAEMSDFVFTIHIRNVFWHSTDCRDGGICVFSSDPKVFAEKDCCIDDGVCAFSANGEICVFSADQRCLFCIWLQRWPNMRFQDGSVMCCGFLMVAEMAEYEFSGGPAMIFGILMVAETAEYAFSVRILSVSYNSDGCRDGGICASSTDPQCLFAW